MSSNNEIVRLNVGGQPYEVSRSLLERQKPDTVLARLVDDDWYPQDNHDEPLFIDRDGERFRFVLDLIRDGKVFLPLTESREALQVDLDYFGLEDPQDAPFDIQYGCGLEEVVDLVEVMDGNVDHELQERDDAIREYMAAIKQCKNEKSAIKTAQNISKRSKGLNWMAVSNKPGWDRTTVLFENEGVMGTLNKSDAQRAYKDAKDSLEVEDFLGHRLEACYRLMLIETEAETFHSDCKFVLERRIKKEAASINKKKSPPPPPRTQPKRKGKGKGAK